MWTILYRVSTLRHAWDHARYCDALEAEIERFAADVRGVDPATRVPTCPDWSIAELVEHVGAVHRWAGRMVADTLQERLDRKQLDLGLPDDRSAYAGWLAAGAGA